VECPLYSMKDTPAVDTRYALESQRCSVRGALLGPNKLLLTYHSIIIHC
jgi:hypothetical protein